MNVLVIYAHPSKESMCGMLFDAVCNDVKGSGHHLRTHDLIAENFNPVFSAYERINHVGDLEQKLNHMPELRAHVEDLQWCDTLILVYPTWWSGQPAVLKGWFDRVLMNGVAWTLPEGKARLSPLLTNVRRLIVVTTHGSPKRINMLQGEPGKRIVFRSVRLMFHLRTRCTWAGVYGMDKMDDAEMRQRKINAVRRRVRRGLSKR
jgi:putative NADPH-quinone reductase